MIKQQVVFFIAILLTAFMVSCSSSDDAGSAASTVVMPVSLSIPSSDGPVTRVGDPGSYEKFKLPKYAYIYIVCMNGDGDSVIVSSTPTLDDTKWRKELYNGNLSTSGDSIYRYTGSLHVIMPTGRAASGKTYVALSTVPLIGLPTATDGYTVDAHAQQTVENYKFAVNNDVRDELANIYSTPYNYYPDGSTYYGTLNDLNTLTPSLDIVLYHVASKLDILWNVDKDVQDTVTIDSMNLSLPDAAESYIFRPLDTAPTTTHTESLNITVGNQWYGRDYLYVIPMTGADDTYNFQTTIKLKNGKTRRETISAGTIIKRQPFTSWMRGSITVK